MTHQEFENLFGQPVTPAEFDVINCMYMQRENESKQAFVARLKKMDLPNLLGEFAVIFKAEVAKKEDATARAMEAERRAARMADDLEENGNMNNHLDQELAELKQNHHDFAAMVAVETHQYDKTATISACIETLGLAGYYRALLNAGCVPTQDDLKLIIEALEKKIVTTSWGAIGSPALFNKQHGTERFVKGVRLRNGSET